MTEFSIKKASLTIGLSVCISLIGIVVSKSLPTIGLFFIFPFLFGISIPLANLTDVGVFKIPKILFAGLLSVGLLNIAVRFSATEFNMYLISGINGAILMWSYSKLIKTVQPTFIHYLMAIVLCLMAMGLSLKNLDSHGVPDFYFTVLLWTSFFTVGLTTSLRKKNTSTNSMNVPYS